MLRVSDFSWGKREEVSKVGLVQKSGKPHIKASIDGLVCFLNDLDEQDLLIVEYKARIKPELAQKEMDRVEDLRMRELMEEDSIFCEVESNDRNSFDFIRSEEERCQALHHAYTYEKSFKQGERQRQRVLTIIFLPWGRGRPSPMTGTSRGQALARAGTIGPQRGRVGDGDDALPKL